MKIRVNGRTLEVAEETTLRDFIVSVRRQPEGVIAELNERVMTRDAWAGTLLREGDSLELVSLVGGG